MASSEHKIDVIINAKDLTKAAFNSAQKSVDSFGGGIKKLGIAIGSVFAVKKIGDFLMDSAKAFGESEAAAKKLETIMIKVNGATTSQVDALKKQAVEMQKLTTVEDDAVVAMQAQLGTFGLSSDAIMRLTEQTINLAVANSGVNVTSDQMTGYADLIGKAMNGNTRIFNAYGIQLTDTQKAQFENGNELERSSMLAELLGSKYGTLARDMKGTYAGQLESFKNQWGDMKEMIGEQLVPVLMKILDWATVTGIPKMIEAIAWLKERWDTNFLGIKTILETAWKVIKLTFDGWIAAIELLISTWDRAVKAYKTFKDNVGALTGTTEIVNYETPYLKSRVGKAQREANGGIIHAASGGLFSSAGTDTVPAMLTPGELVLNRAQQENLARQMSGNNITLNMYYPNFRDDSQKDSIFENLTRVLERARLGVA